MVRSERDRELESAPRPRLLFERRVSSEIRPEAAVRLPIQDVRIPTMDFAPRKEERVVVGPLLPETCVREEPGPMPVDGPIDTSDLRLPRSDETESAAEPHPERKTIADGHKKKIRFQQETSPVVAETPVVTRSGRVVKKPDRLTYS